jgi:hypothetical protein
LILAMLVVSSTALLATSPPPYDPDISDLLTQEVELTADRPKATTTVRLLATAQAQAGAGGSHESHVSVVAAAPEAPEAGDISPEFRVTGSFGEEEALNSGPSDEAVRWRVERLCPASAPCDAPLEIGVEWLNATPGGRQPVILTIEAGIDYRSGLLTAGEAPNGAEIRLEVARELAQVDGAPTLRAQTEAETITLSAEAPFALRHVTIEVADPAIPTGKFHEDDQGAIFAVTGIDQRELASAAIWPDPGQVGHQGQPPGSELPLHCRPGVECRRGYTFVVQWIGRDRDDTVEVTWSLASVLRYRDRPTAPPDDSMTVSVDRVIDTTGAERQRLEAEMAGSIERGPDDRPNGVPIEPALGPTQLVATLGTWQPIPGESNIGVPTSGQIVLAARTVDGAPLRGSVRVSVATRHPVVRGGVPRYEELTAERPQLSLVVIPSLSCYDPDVTEPAGGDGRCTVPFDIDVLPPDESIGPVIVDWSISLQAVAPDGLSLAPGDLRIGPRP